MSEKYKRIIDDITQKLQNGELQAGNKLPSIRQLTQTYQCSKNTILKAYGELEKQHLIYAKAQSGYYVVIPL